MKTWADDRLIQHTKAQWCVGMDKLSPHADDHADDSDFLHAKVDAYHQWHGDQRNAKDAFGPMVIAICCVQLFDGVVHGMKAPQERESMLGPMEPIITK